MENEILRIMDIFKKGNEISKSETETLKRRINEMLKANTALMDKAKDEKSSEDIINQYHIMNSNNDTSIIVKNIKKVDKDEKIIFLNNFDEMIKQMKCKSSK